jgi:G3E family GTPase
VDVRNDLVQTLQKLLARQDLFDYILVETSGLADPTPVAATFFMDNEVAKKVVLDGVVTLVDAVHAQPHLDDPALAEHDNQAVTQIVVADRILLNKADLVPAAALTQLERRIRALNSGAPILRTVQARVDLSQILGLQSFESDALSVTDPHFLEDAHHEHQCDAHCEHAHVHPYGSGAHTHDPSVASVSFTFDEPFDAARVMRSLHELLAASGDDIYRVKGILHVRGDDRRHVLQGVHRILELKASFPWWGEEPASKFVFIGRHLQREKLRACLQACLAHHGAPLAALHAD